MRRIMLTICLLLTILITSCAAPQSAIPLPDAQAEPVSASTPKQLAPTPSVDALLATALKLYGEGKYEEAILQYTAVINIEPKNFDAQFGLGQAYRKNKQSDNAIVPLKAALSIRAESKPAAIELGYAYLDTGAYAETEALAKELLGERIPDLNVPSLTPQQEGVEAATPVPFTPLSNEDGEALTLLLLSLGAQEKTEEVQALLQDRALFGYLYGAITDGSVLYSGTYNESGQREGNGIGIYPEGYVYVGEYRDDVRSGQGKWYYPQGTDYFSGEWVDDLPNGAGELVWGASKVVGMWKDGLEHGEMEEWIQGAYNNAPHITHYKYTCENGYITSRVSLSRGEGLFIEYYIVYAVCLNCPKGRETKLGGAIQPKGISPFGGETVQLNADGTFYR